MDIRLTFKYTHEARSANTAINDTSDYYTSYEDESNKVEIFDCSESDAKSFARILNARKIEVLDRVNEVWEVLE